MTIFKTSELPPAFRKPLIDTTVLEDSPASFECILTKEGFNVKWYLNNTELTDEKRFDIASNKSRQSLTINKCALTDAGEVTCKIIDQAGNEITSSTCKLTVNEKPVGIEKPLKNVKAEEKSEINFYCELNKAVAPENIKWFKDGVEITPDERIEIRCDGPKLYLSIKNARLDDAGKYEMRFGDVSTSANCTVIGLYFYCFI